jgi:hypothetical protein
MVRKEEYLIFSYRIVLELFNTKSYIILLNPLGKHGKGFNEIKNESIDRDYENP